MPTTTPKQFNTSEAGRTEVARFFTERLKRHDFTRYIHEHLAADFACALAPVLHQVMAAAAATPAKALSEEFREFLVHARTVGLDATRTTSPGAVSFASEATSAAWAAWLTRAVAAPAHPSALHALQRIADWNEHTATLAVDHGSNGVRDHYRRVAREALGAAQSATCDPDAELVAYVVAELRDDEHPISRVEPGLPQFFIDTPEGDELLLTDELRAKVEQALGEPLVERVQHLRGMTFTRLVPKSKAAP